MKRICICVLAAAMLMTLTAAFALDFEDESLGFRIHDDTLEEMYTQVDPLTATRGIGCVYFYVGSIPVAEIDVVEDALYSDDELIGPYIADPKGIHRNGYTYILIEAEPSTDEEVKTIPGYAAALRSALESAEFFEPVPLIPSDHIEFSTHDIDGNVVTEAIFAEKKLTMINVWATYCNPCLNEMPELAEMAKEYADDVNILFLCNDLYTREDASRMAIAEAVAQKAGIDRSHILLAEGSAFRDLLSTIVYVPTTFFADAEGKLYKDMVVGANPEGYRATLDKLLVE